MNICGLQKLTLLDYPGHTACTVFTGGCNYRCPFCHNASLVLRNNDGKGIGEEELLAFLLERQGLLDGVVITGGEPTIHPDLPDFIRRVREQGFDVKLDTNGTNPEMLNKLIRDNLVQYVAMDIKNDPTRYAKTTGVNDPRLDAVRESAYVLMSGSVPYEFRTTVVRELHTPQDIMGIGVWLRGAKRYYLQSFVDSGDLIGSGMTPYSREELDAMLAAVKPYIPATELRGVD